MSKFQFYVSKATYHSLSILFVAHNYQALMDLCACSSSHAQSTRFYNAIVTISPSPHHHSAASRAHLAVSARIYWTDTDQDKTTSFFDFRGGNTLLLARLSDSESWDSVENLVSACDGDDGRSIVVQEKLNGPVRRRNLRVNSNVRAETVEQAKQWLNEIRLRVAPSDLVHRYVQSSVESLESNASLEDVKKSLDSLLARNGGLFIADIDLNQDDSQPP